MTGEALKRKMANATGSFSRRRSMERWTTLTRTPRARAGAHIIAECEASLRRLQTDYIDLYQLHRPPTRHRHRRTLRALDDLVRSGKVRYIGTSTFAACRCRGALGVGKS